MVYPLSVGDSDILHKFESLQKLENVIQRVRLKGRSSTDPVVYRELENDTSPMFIHQDSCSYFKTPSEFGCWGTERQAEVAFELAHINCIYIIKAIQYQVTPLIESTTKQFIGVAVTWEVSTSHNVRYLVRKYDTNLDIKEHYLFNAGVDKDTILKDLYSYLETRTQAFIQEYAKLLVAVPNNFVGGKDTKLVRTQNLMTGFSYINLITKNGYHLENNHVRYEHAYSGHILYDDKLRFLSHAEGAILFTELLDGEIRFLVSHNLPIGKEDFNWVMYQHRIVISNGNIQRYLVVDGGGNEVDVSSTVVSERLRSYVNIYHNTNLLAEFEKVKG